MYFRIGICLMLQKKERKTEHPLIKKIETKTMSHI
jgi:hypothetical protein